MSKKGKSFAVKIDHWDFRGLSQPTRCLLEYAGTAWKWDDKLYACASAETFGTPFWYNYEHMRVEANIPLPVVLDVEKEVDRNINICESIASIIELNVDPNIVGLAARNICFDIVKEAEEFRKYLIKLCFDAPAPDAESSAPFYQDSSVYLPSYKLKLEYFTRLSTKLKSFSDFLGNSQWFAAKHLSYVDFLMYDTLKLHTHVKENCLVSFPNLIAFQRRFEEIPGISEYLASQRSKKYPWDKQQDQAWRLSITFPENQKLIPTPIFQY